MAEDLIQTEEELLGAETGFPQPALSAGAGRNSANTIGTPANRGTGLFRLRPSPWL